MSKNSRDALIQFLDYSAEQKLLKSSTASARKAAIKRVFTVLSSTEAADVRYLDTNEIMERFMNSEGANVSEQSLQAYRSRISSSLEEFCRWLENPDSFRSRVTTRERNASIRSDENALPNRLDIPLRENLTISIQRLPFDLNRLEAEKITNIVLAMVRIETKEKQ